MFICTIEDIFARFTTALQEATNTIAEQIDCEKIAHRVSEKLAGQEEDQGETNMTDGNCFEETDDEKLYCVPCHRLSQSLLERKSWECRNYRKFSGRMSSRVRRIPKICETKQHARNVNPLGISNQK